MADWAEEVDRVVREKAAVREIVEACCKGAGIPSPEPPRPAAPAPGTPEQPKGSRPSYGNMVEQIRSVRRPRVS